MKLLTQSEYALLTWAESQAKELLGVHTGGPHEQEHRDKLAKLRKVMLKVKHGCAPSQVVKAKRVPREERQTFARETPSRGLY